MFYELSPWAYGGRIWGLRPISTHLWVLGDFCSWKGMLVLGADNASPSGGKNVTTAEPQSGLWFGKTDDLWGFGKPSGWGGPWWREEVRAGEASDPYLMTGFDNKCLHLENHGESAASFDIEVDIHGDGHFARSERIAVERRRTDHARVPQRLQRALGQSGSGRRHHGVGPAVLHLSHRSVQPQRAIMMP